MKKSVKRSAMAALTAVALMASLLTGCGKKSSGSSNKVDLKNVTYEVVPAGLDDIKGDPSTIKVYDRRVYFLSYEYEDLTDYPADWVDGMPPEDAPDDAWDSIDYKYKNTYHLYSMEQDGSDFKSLLDIEQDPEDNYNLQYYAIGKEGQMYLLYSAYNDDLGTLEYKMEIYDASGKQTGGYSLTDFFDAGADVSVADVLVDKQGRIVIVFDNCILATDEEAKELCRLSIDSCNGVVTNPAGDIIYTGWEEEGLVAKVVDIDKKSFGAKATLGAMYNQYLSGSGDYDFYMNDSNGVTGLTMNGKSQEVLNWVGSNINQNYISSLTALDNGSFLAVYNDYSEGGETEDNGIIFLKKVDPSVVANKVAITYGGLWIDEDTRNAAIKFNKSQNNYQIVFRDYSNEDDPEGKMNADFLAGDVPDIIDLSSVPLDKYAAKGLLTDLYPLIDNDPDLDRSDFMDNILKAMESDGKLCAIAPVFSMNVMAAYGSDVGDKKSVTLDDVMALEKKYGGRAFSSYSTNLSVLSTLCQCNYDTYIDWATGKCSFDSDEFVKTLEYAASYPNEEDIDYEEDVDYVKSVREHKMIFDTIYGMAFEDIEMYDELFEHDLAIVGYPAPEGSSIGMNMNTMVGIYSKSPNVEGAWTFLRTLLSREYITNMQVRGSYGTGFPIRKDSFEDAVKRATTTQAYKDDFGNEIEPLDSSWSYGSGLEIAIKPVSDQQVQIVRDVIASVDHRQVVNNDIDNIINEEAGGVFSGQKSAKDAAGIIQNRVTTYVNENR